MGVMLGACAASQPNLKVLGVADAVPSSAQQETLLVFVEVVNPTGRQLSLSRLEYRLDAESWFQAEGEVALTRVLGAESSAIIEVPVRLYRSAWRQEPESPRSSTDAPVAYSLDGRLFAVTNRIQRSWKISVHGTLDAEAVADARRAPRVRVRIAGGDE